MICERGSGLGGVTREQGRAREWGLRSVGRASWSERLRSCVAWCKVGASPCLVYGWARGELVRPSGKMRAGLEVLGLGWITHYGNAVSRRHTVVSYAGLAGRVCAVALKLGGSETTECGGVVQLACAAIQCLGCSHL